MKKLGAETNMSTAGYAQANGRAERTNQTYITMMRQMVDYNQANWDEVLLFIEFAINSHQSKGTGVSFFMADMGREPRQPLNLEAPAQDDDSTFVSKIKPALQQAQLLDKTRNSHRMEKVLQQNEFQNHLRQATEFGLNRRRSDIQQARMQVRRNYNRSLLVHFQLLRLWGQQLTRLNCRRESKVITC